MKRFYVLLTILLLAFCVSCTKETNGTSENYDLFQHDLVPVCNDEGLWGYVNKNAEVVYEPQFQDSLNMFFDGEGYMLQRYPDGEYVLIDSKGNKVIEETNTFSIKRYNSGYLLFFDSERNTSGIMDVEKNIVVEEEGNAIMFILSSNTYMSNSGSTTLIKNFDKEVLVEGDFDYINFVYNNDYNIGYIVLGENGKQRIYDNQGELCCNQEFDAFSRMDISGYICAYLDGYYYLLNLETKEVSEFRSTHPLNYIEEGVSAFYNDEDILSYIDLSGNIIYDSIDVKYDIIRGDRYNARFTYQESGIIYIYSTYNDFDLIDLEGNILAQNTEERVIRSYNSDYVVFRNNENEYQLESYDGDILIEWQSREIQISNSLEVYFIENLDGSYEMMTFGGKKLRDVNLMLGQKNQDNGYFMLLNDDYNTFSYYDSNGNPINNESYDFNSGVDNFYVYNDGYIIVYQNGLYGVIDTNGNIIIPTEYSDLGYDYYFRW